MSDADERHNTLERIAWVPVHTAGDDAPAVSKISGSPFLTVPWPVCQSCAEPMIFLLQLKLSELPALPEGWLESPEFALQREHGLLQIFHCGEPECALGTGDPFTGSSFTCMSYTWSAPQAAAIRPFPNVPHTALIISGWEPLVDTPCRETLLDLEFNGDKASASDLSGRHLESSKLLGWPTMVRSIEVPCCHLCGSKMTFLFELSTIPFAEGALGFVFVCPTHPNSAFCWGIK